MEQYLIKLGAEARLKFNGHAILWLREVHFQGETDRARDRERKYLQSRGK